MFARINEGVVVEIYTATEGFTLDECFHPDIFKKATIIPSYVTVGCVKTETGWEDAEGVTLVNPYLVTEEPEEDTVPPVEEEEVAEEAPE